MSVLKNVWLPQPGEFITESMKLTPEVEEALIAWGREKLVKPGDWVEVDEGEVAEILTIPLTAARGRFLESQDDPGVI